MSYFIEGLEVAGGMLMFALFVIAVAIILASLPRKRHRPPRRVWHELDEVLPQDNVIKFTSVPYDWERSFNFGEWERKFRDEGSVK